MTVTLQQEIKLDSDLHRKILASVLTRYQMSKLERAERVLKWNEAEDLFRAYVKDTPDNAKRKRAKSAGNPGYTQIAVPYSYASLMTAHTYWSAVFLSRSPILQFTGRHGEPQSKIQAVEALMDYQVNVGGMIVPYYMWLLDAGKYGEGVIGNYWVEEQHAVTRIEEVPETINGKVIEGKFKRQRVREFTKGYVGNKLYNVRPYDFFPDTRVSVTNFQDGEFCGRRVEVGWNTILKGQANGVYFNIEELRKRKNTKTRDTNAPKSDAKAGLKIPNVEAELGQQIFDDMKFVNLLEMYIELVPLQWKLGKGTYPEKWVFTVAEESVIIGAQPLGLYHNKFPFAIQTYEIDTYSLSARGLLEISEPLEEIMSWLFNSHFFNVRKALNDQFIYDPSRIISVDAQDGGPGKLWRLRPRAYGTDPKTAFTQIATVDVTSGHLRDANSVGELIQRVLGISDNVMGAVTPGGRKTATEIRTSSTFSTTRLKTTAEFNSALGWSPLSQIMLQNTQQLYDEERQFRIVGDLVTEPVFSEVRPEDIQGFFDFVPVDGTLPVDRFAQANLWKDILFNIGRLPDVAAQYDMGGIFSWMAQLAGLKNITQFKIKTQVIPDEAIGGEIKKGNLIPLEGRLPGAGNAGAAGGTG